MSTLQHAYQHYLDLLGRHQRLVWLILTVYLVTLVAVMLVANISITPDRIAIALFLAALFMGHGLSFLRDWVPFLILLMLYEGLRGFADIKPDVHITDVISVERMLFWGSVPTLWLQHHLHTASVSVLDIASTIIYFLHFPLPLCFAFWLWLKNKNWYWQFILSLMLLCLAAFVTYLVFPVMPPWMAGRDGHLEPVVKVIDSVLQLFPHQMSVSELYHNLNPNQVAAIPSLHAAWPWLVFLMFRQVKGRTAFWFLPYCFAVWFAIVYLGEHYVVDAIIGVIYAQLAFWAGARLYPRITSYLAYRRTQKSTSLATTDANKPV